MIRGGGEKEKKKKEAENSLIMKAGGKVPSIIVELNVIGDI